MTDFFARQARGKLSTIDPLDNTLTEEPKPFPWENENWQAWGWYPFLYESLESAILGLSGASLDFPSWPNISLAWDLESVDLIDPPGGTGGGGGEEEGSFGDEFAQQFCQPVLLAGQCPAAKDTQKDQCQSILGPCEFISLSLAVASTELGDAENISEGNRIKDGLADGEGSSSDIFANSETKCCGTTKISFELTVGWSVFPTSAGIFCNVNCQCVGWNHGASLQRVITEPPSGTFPEGRISKAVVCAAGNSGHGCDSPQANWGFLPKATANNLKGIAQCIKDTVEDPENGCGSTCPNCEINTDSVEALDPFGLN